MDRASEGTDGNYVDVEDFKIPTLRRKVRDVNMGHPRHPNVKVPTLSRRQRETRMGHSRDKKSGKSAPPDGLQSSLTLALEHSVRDVCAGIDHGSGGRSRPSFDTSGRHTLYKRGPRWPDDHSSGRRNSPSTGEACDETRCPTHNRDSVRSLPTFLANSPSPLYFLGALESSSIIGRYWTTTSGGRHGTTSFQSIACAVKVNTKVIVW